MSTAAEKRHMDRVAHLSCAVCGRDGPSVVHHLREGQGMSQRARNWLVIPLCPEDHTGRRGIRGDRSEMRLRKLSELDLLANTIARLSA